jgi:hypothetical protein
MRKGSLILILSLSLLSAGCQTKESPPAAASSKPDVHNSFTDYVERGVTTMKKADSVAAAANAQNQQTSQQAQSAGE